MTTKEQYKACFKALLEPIKKAISAKMDGSVNHIVEEWHSPENLIWYRKWSNGWIEQGGVVTDTTSNTKSTVLLVTPFTTTSYTLEISMETKDVWINGWGVGTLNKTTTSFDFRVSTISNATGTQKINWYSCGF